MKVLFDEQIFSMQSYGGISRYFCELARHLHEIPSVNAKIVSPLCTNFYVKKLPMALRLGLPLPHLVGANKLAHRFNPRLASTLISLSKPDIVHQTYYGPGRTGYGHRGKVVITVYDMIHELFPEHYPNDDKTSELKRKAIERADHVICISENTRTDLLAHININIEKTSVVYLGADHLRRHVSPVPAKRGRPYFLFVGSRARYKNFERVLMAFAQIATHPRMRLICCGGGPLTDAELVKIKKLGVSHDQIEWMEGDNKTLGQLYSSAKALMYPSLYEGFGLPPLEAMLHSCPVICSNTSSLPEIVGTAAELVDPQSVDSIATAMKRMLVDVDRIELLKQAGKVRASQFTWKKCAEDTMAVYQMVNDQL